MPLDLKVAAFAVRLDGGDHATITVGVVDEFAIRRLSLRAVVLTARHLCEALAKWNVLDPHDPRTLLHPFGGDTKRAVVVPSRLTVIIGPIHRFDLAPCCEQRDPALERRRLAHFAALAGVAFGLDLLRRIDRKA